LNLNLNFNLDTAATVKKHPNLHKAAGTDETCHPTGTKVQKQKGIVTYGLAPNRQNPFAGAAHSAIFNTWRRASAQVLYIIPPFIAAYYIMDWAIER
jgi:hypothetical protein